MNLFSPKILTPPAGVVAYLLASVLFWKTPKPPAPVEAPSGTVSDVTRQAIPSWDFVNPEADQLMQEIRSEKHAVEMRQKQLDDEAKGIDSEKGKLAEAQANVKKMQKDFDQIVLRVKDEEVVNLKRLAKVYANMAPETTASIFSQLDDSVIVKIMMFMKDGDTATVLENLAKKGDADAKRAAGISERLRLSTAHNTPPPK